MMAAAPAYSPQPSWSAALSELPDLELLWHEPLARHTTFRVGGPVTCLARPRSLAALLTLLAWLRGQEVPHLLLGAGSNLLAPDEGWDGVAIQLVHCCNDLRMETRASAAAPGKLRVGAGVRLARLLRFCLRHGLAGFEPLVGIPGTVGGSLIMNAGTASGCISDVLDTITVVDASGAQRLVHKRELGISYRSIALPQGTFILEAGFDVKLEAPESIRMRLRELLRRRHQVQPLGLPSAGCVFKNPPGRAAGALIDQAGLKGWRCGDAQISARHANWIVNLGRATAQDILTLVRIAEERVSHKFGIQLEREIKVLSS
jgi:UDP-N-acetylmuramate dehydrogenase